MAHAELPVPDIEPAPIGLEQFLEFVPEKFELVDGYLFDGAHEHARRMRLLALLLTNEGLARVLQLAPEEKWREALHRVFGKGEGGTIGGGLGPRAVPTGTNSYEEILAWLDEDTWAEWVNGEVVMLSPASDRHQDLVRFLTAVLSVFTEVRRLGMIRPAPFLMKTGPELPGREPDLLFVAASHLDRLKETYLDGPADVVVEIASPESGARDRGEKFYEYETGGVQEYWLIDSERGWAEFYRLGPEGRYRPIFAGREGLYRSEAIPDFWLRVEWLFQEPLPWPVRIVGEIAGVDPGLLKAFERAIKGERP
ncbi:MAG: Uma2 family endonuclease [Candidatus Methylomirabilales bacterium]